eukprot:COSAG01_NODE_25662_length_737_cov_22.114420_2_plen_42_part_01
MGPWLNFWRSLQQEARIVVEALIAIRDVAWRRGHEVGDGVGR